MSEKKTETVNPGDQKLPPDAPIEAKADKTAVEYEDVLMNKVEVPTYVVAEGEDGEKKALHHVEDAEEISDVIRQARVDEDGNRVWN